MSEGITGSIKSFLFSDPRTKDVPPPPPRPEYDPKKEPPKWSWGRMYWGLPVDKGPEGWPKVGHRPESDDEPDWRGVVRSNILPYPEPEPYPFGKRLDPRYFYFDTPDYADPFKKLGYATKFFAQIGFLVASVRGMLLFKHMTMRNNWFLFSNYMVPVTAAGVFGAASTIVAANLRGKKDDRINYAVGGFAASTVFSNYGYRAWTFACIGCVGLAVVFKYNAETNGQLYPMNLQKGWSLNQHGFSADNGIASGDLRFLGKRHIYGDPGRDTRPGGVF